MTKDSVSFGSVEIFGATVDAHGLAHAGDEKQQRDARIAHEIAQGVDAIVAAAVGNDDRMLIHDAHKTGRIAARRTIETFGAAGRQHAERRRVDQLAVLRRDPVGLLEDGGRVRRVAVHALEFFGRRDRMRLPGRPSPVPDEHMIPRNIRVFR